MRLSLVTAPTLEPITLPEAKLALKVDGDDHDPLLASLIAEARQLFEGETERQVITATWRGRLDRFPCSGEKIEVPKSPLLAVSSITYMDTAGVSQTWSASEYQVDAFAGPFARPGLIYPKSDFEYPQARAITDAVTVNFTAGYGATAELVPESVKGAIKKLLYSLFWLPGGAITGTIVSSNPDLSRLLNRFRGTVYA